MPDAPTPDPTEPLPDVPKRGFTLDLSSPGASARPKRPKGFVPVVQQTINLTTRPASPPVPDAPAGRPAGPDAGPRSLRGTGRTDARDGRPQGRRDDANEGAPRAGRDNGPRAGSPRTDSRQPDARRGDSRRPDGARTDGARSGGTSLADLLDEATLARLRGSV